MRLRYGPLLLALWALAAAGCESEEAVAPAPAPRPTARSAPEAPAVPAPVTDGPLDPAPAPDFTLPGPGGDFALAEQRGHVVVLNFWATWNELSLEGMDALAGLHETLAGEGLVVVGIAEDDDALAALEAWAAENALPPYPVVADTAGAVARLYGDVELLPTTVVVDREGRLRARHTGILSEDELLDLLGPVLIEDDAPLRAQPTGQPGVVQPLAAADAEALVRAGAVLVDVREEPARQAVGALPYALHRPLALLAAEDLPANFATPLIFADASDGASAEAAERAVRWGYRSVYLLEGGVGAWEEAGLPLEPVPARRQPPAPESTPPLVPTRPVLG
ncbi:MAG TPA: redoxin domain-containing protein [Rubricoccaceae bacterium]|nr:redoxin domain-containing protein [Rubricoccaceae bacterium]